MPSPAQRIREAVEAFHRGVGQAELLWLRDGQVEKPWLAAAELLSSDEVVELWGKASTRSEFRALEQSQLESQLAYVAAFVARAPARPILRSLREARIPVVSETETPLQLVDAMLRGQTGEAVQVRARALSGTLADVSARLLEINEEAQSVWLAKTPDDAKANALLCERALQLLAATDDAARDLVRDAARKLVPSGGIAWHTLFAALRRAELDGLAKPARRLHRLAAGFRKLGFEGDMSSRMRAERALPPLFPAAQLATLSVPGDVRVATPTFEYGVLTDLYTADSLGRALALALVSPALAPETRWPVAGGVSRTLGALSMQLRADPLYLRRVDGLPPSEAELLARHAALAVLLQTRVDAALLLAATGHVRDTAERSERLVSGLSRALCIELPKGLAVLAFRGGPEHAAALRGRLTGLGVHAGLRERFDADWFLNPRASDPLRGACTRGTDLAPEAFCEELGVPAEAAARRLLELLA